MIIDTHAHALHDAFLDSLCRKPAFGLAAERGPDKRFWIKRGDGPRHSLDENLFDVPKRVASLARRGVDLQLIGPPPGFVAWPGGAAGVEYARALNEHGSRVAAQGQGRLELMAALAVGEPDKCAYELERAADLYGARSALLPASAGGRPLDGPEFDALFTVAEKLGVLLFMHPVSADTPARFPLYGVQVLVQWPFETTLAVTRMIFEGVLDRHPGLQLLLAHGGGNLIFLKGRLNSAYEAEGWEADPYYRKNISKAPGEYYKQLFFDTCALSPESVDFTIQIAGADRVMFGTDYPFDIGDPEAKRALPALERLDSVAQRRIYRENAEAVLAAARKPGRSHAA
ncbi:MAG TPA: amidohydrolase family protein [Burkholderiales bacterium]|nr:amidohydrolase family protein [Burkholderiales bacterium]